MLNLPGFQLIKREVSAKKLGVQGNFKLDPIFFDAINKWAGINTIPHHPLHIITKGVGDGGGVEMEVRTNQKVFFECQNNTDGANNWMIMGIDDGNGGLFNDPAQNEAVLGTYTTDTIHIIPNNVIVATFKDDSVLLPTATIPVADPSVAGQLWRDGTDLKISLG